MVWKWATPGNFFGLVAVAADNAAAVTENAHDAAVFPVGPAVLRKKAPDAQQVFDHVLGNLVFNIVLVFGANFGFLLQVGHEARPRPRLQAGPTKGFHVLPSFTSII
jgi:hypothetical protein